MPKRPKSKSETWVITVLLAMAAGYAVQAQTLDELLILAEQNNKTIRVSTEIYQASREAYGQSRTLRLPDINATLALGYNGPAFITDRYFSHPAGVHIPEFGNNFSLQVSQIIYAGGAIDSSIWLSEMGMRISELDIEKNRQEVRFYITGLYLDLIKLYNTAKVIEQNILLSEQIIDKTKARVEQGTLLKNDITRYELQLEALRLQKLKVEASCDIINYSLCEAVGLPDNTAIRPVETNLLATNYNGTSPAIRQAELAVDMANQRLSLAKAARIPKVSLVAEYSLNGPITIEIPAINKNFNYWFVGLGLQYNLSSFFKSKHDIRRAVIEKEAAADALALTEEHVNTAIFAAQTDLTTAQEELYTCDKQVQLAADNYSIVLNRYQNGLALVTDMVDASNMKLASEIDRENARINIIFCMRKIQYLKGAL